MAARAAAALVATIAGAASWEHIASVAYGAGERPWVAYSLPAAIDGLIVVGVAALLEDRRTGRVPRASARLAVAVGVLATLAANIASAEPTWTARLVAVAAPVSFLLAVEVLTRTGRQPATGRTPGRTATRTTRRTATRTGAAAKVAKAAARRPDATAAELAKLAGVSPRTVRRVNGARVATTADTATS
ncbi:MAG: DUF2637 domain-containing protein [Micromonosporaceae bacterium]|nr:DUF2637 domain-containing protein [Micromonosporaceae bacterium]